MNQEGIEILVCNDDGIFAPGLQALVAAVSSFGKVHIVAPDKPQSGMGHAITVGHPLRFTPRTLPGTKLIGYAGSGTPVDCVKWAIGVLLKHKPDLIVSGINHGYNSSISVVYSGTMSAALEGCVLGVPSIGFSLGDHSEDADFSSCGEIIHSVVSAVLKNGLIAGTLLNVNIPPVSYSQLAGIKVTRQAVGRWVEEFDTRIDPQGKPYYWLGGKFLLDDEGEDTDEWAVSHNYVSVCPVMYDMTDHNRIAALNRWHLTLPKLTNA
ncbi:MAG: 5'/3'-nucleotidase SurE [Bacteroidia bacterium]|nr:5'/3'-nucleotidase SurE [Bacteroidia bacterium]